jgi:hypothetical protein
MHEMRTPADRITIEGVGELSFDARAVETRRPDIFRPGHFSVFDILVHLHERADIDLRYRFDREADTHVVESLNGRPHSWYNVFYEGGWSERSVFRMDYYPYKDGMTVPPARRHVPAGGGYGGRRDPLVGRTG